MFRRSQHCKLCLFRKAQSGAAENEALLKAIARGHESAGHAGAARMSLGKLLSISEGYDTSIYRNLANISLDSPKGMGESLVPISPGEIKVTATVTMVYQLQ